MMIALPHNPHYTQSTQTPHQLRKRQRLLTVTNYSLLITNCIFAPSGPFKNIARSAPYFSLFTFHFSVCKKAQPFSFRFKSPRTSPLLIIIVAYRSARHYYYILQHSVVLQELSYFRPVHHGATCAVDKLYRASNSTVINIVVGIDLY